MQPRIWSLIEVILNTIVGFVVAMLAQALIFPLYGFKSSWGENFQIAAFFTVVSIIRSYWMRRFFNKFHGWQARGSS